MLDAFRQVAEEFDTIAIQNAADVSPRAVGIAFAYNAAARLLYRTISEQADSAGAAEPTTICAECKFCKQWASVMGTDYPTQPIFWQCLLPSAQFTDPLTGSAGNGLCRDMNDGHCPHFVKA